MSPPLLSAVSNIYRSSSRPHPLKQQYGCLASRHRCQTCGVLAGVIGLLFFCTKMDSIESLFAAILGSRSLGNGYQPVMGSAPESGGKAWSSKVTVPFLPPVSPRLSGDGSADYHRACAPTPTPTQLSQTLHDNQMLYPGRPRKDTSRLHRPSRVKRTFSLCQQKKRMMTGKLLATLVQTMITHRHGLLESATADLSRNFHPKSSTQHPRQDLERLLSRLLN